ncbi:MAG: oligosaccharide flippase family protein [Bacteroidales bacterium]|jgi:O-antigen/teichoic acid export membrane protein
MNKITRIFRTDNFLSLTGNLVFAFFGFASIFLLARTLSKSDFGEYVLYLSGMSLLEMIRTGITSTPLVRFLAGSADPEEQKRLIGASWFLSVLVTIGGVVLLYAALLLFPEPIHRKGFGLFFTWYPILSIIILPLNTALSVLQARKKFGQILVLRSVNMSTFFIFLVINYFWLKVDLIWIVIAHQGSHLLAGMLSLVKGWSVVSAIRYATREQIRSQLKFGRFSLVTLIGSNLLKSSDTFIIGIMMSAPDVAYYSIPIKLIEIIEIPLRSLVSVAFPSMSKASRLNDTKEVRSIYYSNTGLLTWLYIPLILVLFVLAKPLVLLLGGPEYAGSYLIFWIFLIYGLLLPMDRFSGVALDAINKPNLNMIKVLIMATLNIVGDILVIHFWSSLPGVAICTVLNATAGVIAGNLLLHKELGTNFFKIFPYGWNYLKYLIAPFLKRGSHAG